MTRLYHGSNVVIEQIDLSRSKRGKDFGQGFYLSASSLVEELKFRGDHAILEMIIALLQAIFR